MSGPPATPPARRVAMVCPYGLDTPGGVQGQVLGLAAALAAAGHAVTVLAPGAVGADAGSAAVVDLGGTVRVPANGSVAPLALGPGAARQALRAVAAMGPDVVHLHEPLAPGPNWALLARAAAPLVGTFHRAGASPLYRLLGPAARWAAGRLAVRCAVSDEAAATAAAALGGTYEVVGNGVDLDRYRRAAPWPAAGPTAFFVGRHEDRKGLAVLLDAWERLGTAGMAGTLWVAGAGPRTADLRRRHPPSDRLEWLGVVGDEEKAARLAACDVCCAPSLGGESFGVVLLEALAAGAAVVASDLPGYRAVLGGHGALVPPGDAEALAGALRRALQAGRPDEAARRSAAEHAGRWSMPAVAARYAACYGRVLEGAATGGSGPHP